METVVTSQHFTRKGRQSFYRLNIGSVDYCDIAVCNLFAILITFIK